MEKKPIQLYVPALAYRYLESQVEARKASGDTQASMGQLIRESLAEKFGLSADYFSVGEWGVRKGKAEKGEGE